MKHHARLALLSALVPLGCLLAGSIPEPPTLVYGRVVYLIGGQEFAVTSGTLSWSLRPLAGGTVAVALTTPLGTWADTDLCYRLAIPHEALISGLTVSDGTVALGTAESVHELVNITVDGAAARPLLPGSVYLALSQAGRAKAHRVDLVLDASLTDSDGDGLPDLWETAFGLDPDANDAAADPDADGLSNSQEFARGTDPSADNRIPALLTTRLTAYASCRTGVLLDVADSDTAPAGLTLTLLSTPADARLLLTRAGAEQALAAGSTLTLAEVQAGSLVLEETAGTSSARELEVSISDGTAGREPVVAQVAVTVCQPLAIASGWLTQAPPQLREALTMTGLALPADRTEQLAWLAGRWFGRTIWQAEAPHAPAGFHPPTTAVVLGGEEDDTLSGSAGPDLLCGGAGADTLTGGAAADVFLFEAGPVGTKTVTDFKAAEEDTLDFSAALRGTSNRIEDYLRVTPSGADIVLDLDADGAGGTYADGSVTLLGAAAGFDLTPLWASGRILAAALTAPTLVSVTVAEGDGAAAETGPRIGRFALQRLGMVQNALTVAVSFSGSATAGSDYAVLPATVTFAAGSATATVEVSPFLDYIVEPAETVVLSLVAGEGYQIGTPNTATITIADLAELVSIEAFEPQALVTEAQSGTILVRREGMLARPATVWLTIGGSARQGTDVVALPTRVNFAAWETAVTIDVQPLPGATVSGDRESVLVTLRPDPAGQYTLGEVASATVWLYLDAAAALDSNGDGISDREDADFDGLTLAEEALLGSDPTVPTLVLQRGWNLVAIPGLPSAEQTLAAQLGARFQGFVWGWESGRYVLLTDQPMQPGRGYLVFVNEDIAIDLQGLAEATGEVSLVPGWNLVGPIRGGPWPGETQPPVYRLGSYGTYERLDPPLLLPMAGYWVYSDTVLTVQLP